MSQKRNRTIYLTGHNKLDSSWTSVIPEEGPFDFNVGRLITHYNEQYIVAIIPGNRLPDLFKGEAIRTNATNSGVLSAKGYLRGINRRLPFLFILDFGGFCGFFFVFNKRSCKKSVKIV